VQRLRLSFPAAPIGARLLAAACVALSCGGVQAQTPPPVYPDPLAPDLQTDPRSPPRFQKSNRAPYSQAPASAVFTPPASGAGSTGFDSTNTRKFSPRRTARAGGSTNAQTIAPGLPTPVTPSPYQKPAPETGAYAQAPGTPPVELLTPAHPLPKRRAPVDTDDPYAPVGIRTGSFDIFPAVELIGGYNSNPGQEPSGKGASLYTVAPELRAQSNWSRHELKVELRGSYTGFSPDETPTLSRPNLNGRVDGRVDVTRDTRIDLGARVLVSTDNPSSPNLQAGLAKLPVYTTFGGSAGLGQRFSRFDVSIKGDVERTAYQNSELTDGSTASNEDRNYNQYGARLRGGYELMPGVTPFVEVGADTRVHDLETDVFGYRRNSKGVDGNIGTSFEITRVLTGDVSIGYVKRTYDDPRLSDLSGMIGNASLVWSATGLTTVKLSASSSIGESTIPGVSGVFYRDVGLQVDHAFRRWLIGTLKLGFGLDTYKDAAVETSGGTTTTVCNCVTTTSAAGETLTDRQDQRYSVGLGVTYKVDRSVQIKGEFRQDWLRSNVAGVDYTASTFLVGLRLQK
jgi:hypothetical protein